MKISKYFIASAFVFVPVAVNAQTSGSVNATAAATANAGASAVTSGSTTSTQAQQQSSAQARIDAAMQAAAKAKIPASLVQSKVAEGEAKHVPPQRIATAVEARVEALIDASEAIGRAKAESASESELSVSADAIQAGVSQKALVKVYRDAPAERRVIAVAVLTDLVRIGSSSEQALARVSGALASNVALANLQAEVASQLHLGGLSSTLDATGIVKIK